MYETLLTNEECPNAIDLVIIFIEFHMINEI